MWHRESLARCAAVAQGTFWSLRGPNQQGQSVSMAGNARLDAFASESIPPTETRAPFASLTVAAHANGVDALAAQVTATAGRQARPSNTALSVLPRDEGCPRRRRRGPRVRRSGYASGIPARQSRSKAETKQKQSRNTALQSRNTCRNTCSSKQKHLLFRLSVAAGSPAAAT